MHRTSPCETLILYARYIKIICYGKLMVATLDEVDEPALHYYRFYELILTGCRGGLVPWTQFPGPV